MNRTDLAGLQFKVLLNGRRASCEWSPEHPTGCSQTEVFGFFGLPTPSARQLFENRDRGGYRAFLDTHTRTRLVSEARIALRLITYHPVQNTVRYGQRQDTNKCTTNIQGIIWQ